MNGIKMADCRFYVNKDKRTVICVIPNTRARLDDFVFENFRFNDIDIYKTMDWSLVKMPDSFMGKAVCATEDEWDEELGRMIAFSRAKDKFYRSFFKRANNLVNTLDRRLGDMIETFNDFGDNMSFKKEMLKRKIEERVQK